VIVMEMDRKKNLVYFRVSTGVQKLTLESQRCAVAEKVRELNLTVHEDDFLVDAGISGFATTAEQRPAMAKLLKWWPMNCFLWTNRAASGLN